MDWDTKEKLTDTLHTAINNILTLPEYKNDKPLLIQLVVFCPFIPIKVFRKWFPDNKESLIRLVRMGILHIDEKIITLNKLLVEEGDIPDDILLCERCSAISGGRRKPRHQRPWLCTSCQREIIIQFAVE